MNWGAKILIVYLAFVAGIVFMVFKSSSQTNDLVTSDYYAKELIYQQKIDEIKRVSSLSAPVECVTRDHTVTITFPKDFSGKPLSGEAVLYCPSNEKLDIKKQFEMADGQLQIAAPASVTGYFELHLYWKCEGVSYYFEKKLFL